MLAQDGSTALLMLQGRRFIHSFHNCSYERLPQACKMVASYGLLWQWGRGGDGLGVGGQGVQGKEARL